MGGSINDIILIEHDPIKILEDARAFHEEETGKPLPEADLLNVAYRTVAAMFSVGLAAANDTAKQNFLRFARGERLDLKGEMYGVRGERIGDGYAKTIIRCWVSGIQDRPITIKAGTRFLKDTYIFSSEKEGIVVPGNLYTDIEVGAIDPGYLPTYKEGEITQVVDLWDFYERAENITKVEGGTAEQEDDSYRKALMEIPESFSTAGPSGAYEFWVKSATLEVTDVFIDSPSPCVIDLYLLGTSGEPVSAEGKVAVLEAVSQEDRSPQGDRISIKDCSRVEFTIDLTHYIYSKDQTRIMEMDTALKNELANYQSSISSKTGGEINPQDIVAIAKQIGFKRIDLRSPRDYQQLTGKQVAVCTNINTNSGGVEGN